MKITLKDGLGYTMHLTDLQECPPALVWGSSIFLKAGSKSCKRVRHLNLGAAACGPIVIRLNDKDGNLVHSTGVNDCPPALTWEDGVYKKIGKRLYQRVRHVVLADTAQLRPLSDARDREEPTPSERVQAVQAVDSLTEIECQTEDAGPAASSGED